MAWIHWHHPKDGSPPTAHVQWRDPKTGVKASRGLGVVDALTAEVERIAVERGVEARPETRRWLSGKDLLAAFLGHVKAKGGRDATGTMYREVLETLVEAWEGTPPARWSRPMFEVFLAQHPGWSPRSVQMRVTYARILIRFAAEEGLGCPDFVGRFRGPKVRRKEPKAWSAEECAAILRASKETRGKKYVVPVHLAALAAVSQGDLRTLTKGEVDLAGGWITRPKGRRKTGAPMRLWICPELAAVLEPVVKGPPTALLLPWFPKKDAALHALHRICDLAGVPRGGWHKFRHTLATTMDEEGAGLGAIRGALGQSPSSMEPLRYVARRDAAVAAGMQAAAKRLVGAGC